ncbi:MAG: SpoIIE family protein phosphatase [Ignavibacteriaceae bacterium]|nr:SpoIIE family protein phosphatase [Ignavibacteriaceae bacterium]
MTNADSQRVQRNLTALIEFSRIINTSLDLNFTLNNLLFSCFGKFLTTKGFVALYSGDELNIAASKGLPHDFPDKLPDVTDTATRVSNGISSFLKDHHFEITEVIESSRKKLGIIALGEKINKAPYSDEEKEFLKIILNLAATSIENSQFIEELKVLNRQLDGRLNSLSSLFELSKEFSALVDEGRISKLLIYSLLGNFMMSGYAVIYCDDRRLRILESTYPKAVLMSTIEGRSAVSINRIMQGREIFDIFPGLESFAVSLCIPMQVQGESRGYMVLGPRINKSDYSEKDREFIYSVGGLAINALENKRLFKEALEKQKMEEELQIAKEIQKNLLPKFLPQIPEIEFAADSIPSKQIGGDYYDILQTGDSLYTVAVGDVSGKGVPAALLMANLQAFLKVTAKQNLPIEEATGLINNLITENTSDGRFITFFWLILDADEKNLQYVNAGHNPPLFIRNGKISHLDKGGIIFGVAPTMIPYIAEDVSLQKDDLIVLFTDGVTEAKNPDDDEYSDERFESLILRHASSGADEIMKVIKDDLREFVKATPQSDDITVVILKVR